MYPKNDHFKDNSDLREVLISNYTWKEYEKIANADNLLIIPVGALEQHGPHLPLATDALLGKAFARELALQLGAYMTEPFIYGMRSDLFSGGGELFPGTCSLQPSTFLNLLQDVLDEFQQDGFKRFVLLNAHYENSQLLREAARKHVRAYPNTKILFSCWWDMLPKEKIPDYFPEGFPGMDLEHAGVLETSVMLYWYPQLVKAKEFFPKEVVNPPGFELYPEKMNKALSQSGALATAHLASAEIGRKIVIEVLSQLLQKVESNLEFTKALSKKSEVCC